MDGLNLTSNGGSTLMHAVPIIINKLSLPINESKEFNINSSILNNETNSVLNIAKNVTVRQVSSGGICHNEDTDVIKVAKAVAYSLVILTSLVCNSLVASVVVKNKRMRTAINLFIVNMAISDLMITIFFMPRMLSRIFTGIEWKIEGTPGLILCKISPSMQELCSSLSVLMFIAIAVERFLAVLMPLKMIITKKMSYIINLSIWVCALAVRFPTFYGLQILKVGKNAYCAPLLSDPLSDKIYNNFSFIIFYGVPVCIAIILYSGIIIMLKRRIQPGNANHVQQNIHLRRNYKILKMLVTVVICFALCWFLYFCLPVLTTEMDYQTMCYLFFPRFFLSHLNCAINPMIYLVCIQNYRRNVRSLLIKIFPRVSKPVGTSPSPQPAAAPTETTKM